MNSFLSIVAGDLLKKYGCNLSNITIVFPNKRASLFLNEELIRQSGNIPVWSPQYMTISELFRSASDLIVADQIKLVCELYSHYAKITQTTETLDDFYGWGEMMLADFDDLDKNMGNSRLIFENTSQLHEYDTVPFLTDEQKTALKKFFANFSDNHESVLKQNFLKLWNNMGTIYDSFRQSLHNQGLAYEGMLYREVIENNLLDTNDTTKYIFVGFNLLQKVEQRLFEYLAKEGKAAFYWDYDRYYMREDNEAGRFIREMMRCFPNEITEESHPEAFDNMKQKDVTYISASSEDIQARYVTQWLTPERIAAGKRTAIVLCDEKLLPTVIHALPESVQSVNITTGYPLSQTLVATFVKEFFSLKMMGGARRKAALRLHSVNNVLRHPYTKYISDEAAGLMEHLNTNHIYYPTLKDIARDENLEKLFAPLTPEEQNDNKSRNVSILAKLQYFIKTVARKCEEVDSNATNEEGNKERNSEEHNMQLMQESLYRMHQILTRLISLIEEDNLDIDTMTLQGLLNKIIRSTSVPFHGEPIIGLQIMGVLETRNLDFDNILILSANEGNMPKGVNDSSFIPHTIRRSYGLTTVENKVAIYAYYFHRMIQRAGDVTLTYNNTSSELRTCEMSRFMMQLLAESSMNITTENMVSDIHVSSNTIEPITKNAEVIRKMNEKARISPSALNDYIKCQLIYFYKDICGIKDDTESDEEEMDNRVFGNIFHKAAQILYNDFKGKTIKASDIEGMLKDPSVIERAIDQGFKEELFKMGNDELKDRKMPDLDGTQIINRNILRRILRSLLEYDKKNCPFKIIDLECHVKDFITLNTDNGEKKLMIHGYIDRLDCVMDESGKPVVRVVDYKTGKQPKKPAQDLEELFSEEADYHSGYYLQTLLYCNILASPESTVKDNPDTSGLPVAPALLYVFKAHSEGYDPILLMGKEKITDSKIYADEYKERFKNILSDIYDSTKPFTPTTDTAKCSNCFYRSICGRYK